MYDCEIITEYCEIPTYRFLDIAYGYPLAIAIFSSVNLCKIFVIGTHNLSFPYFVLQDDNCTYIPPFTH